MNIRFFPLIGCALLLSACAPVHDLLSFNQAPPPSPPPADVAAPPPAQPADWCQHVAADAASQAAASGFDTATQERMTRQSFEQCTAMAGQS